jgi:hypothetical protein
MGDVRILVRWSRFRSGVADGRRLPCDRASGVVGIEDDARRVDVDVVVEALGLFFGERYDPTSNKAERGELLELDEADPAAKYAVFRGGTVRPRRRLPPDVCRRSR